VLKSYKTLPHSVQDESFSNRIYLTKKRLGGKIKWAKYSKSNWAVCCCVVWFDLGEVRTIQRVLGVAFKKSGLPRSRKKPVVHVK